MFIFFTVLDIDVSSFSMSWLLKPDLGSVLLLPCPMAFLAAVVHPGVQNHMVSILTGALYAVADILAHFVYVHVSSTYRTPTWGHLHIYLLCYT